MASSIPIGLVKQIQEGNCILFLGSGASFGAINDSNTKVPLGQDLADAIAKKFLTEDYVGSSLAYVSELAISEHSLVELQKYIQSLFKKFKPADFHKLISTFAWKAIFTTNYDTIVEQIYNSSTSVQRLSVVIKDTRQQEIFVNPKSLPYYKLHGSITKIDDENVPLILTIEQYITHRTNRGRLFDTLKELAYDFPILFVGYSMSDYNIRAILNEISKSLDKRPRSYMISPTIKDEEIRLWEGKKVTPIKVTFKQFLEELNEEISPQNRVLASFRPTHNHPIFNKFNSDSIKVSPTENFLHFINEEIDFIHTNFATEPTKPEHFYNGYFENWDPIAKNLDIKRSLINSILSEVFIEEAFNTATPQNLILIKGYAGSGKSVFIKRLAWEAAITYEKFCIYLKPSFKINYDSIAELYNYTKERIFFFVDGVYGRDEDIKSLLEKAKKDSILITIVCSERTSVWNTDCQSLYPYLTQDYSLKYLNDNEINSLLVLLERHNCLGVLSKLNKEEQIKALSETANRQLLVALYEATKGIPFENIIKDEYDKISSASAKSMYLTVCILHRLGAAARAGLISRVHDITFNEFTTRLFKPLEFIVFDRKDYYINDYVYLSRHKQVAEMVFETVLNTSQDRYDEYVRILNYLNTDFENDRIAFFSMTNAKKLMQIFNDPIFIRNIFKLAEEKSPDNPKLKQQRAIYEMTSSGGSLDSAEKYLKQASLLSSNDPVIQHSVAELYLKKAEISSYVIEQNRYLQESTELCNKLLKKNMDSVYPYSTILKILLFKLKRGINNNEPLLIESIVREFEKNLNNAQQQNPFEESLLSLEASFNEIFNDIPAARNVLSRAYSINKASPFIAIKYASLVGAKEGDIDQAITILAESCKLNPADKDINFNLAINIMKKDPTKLSDIIHYLRRSFTKGDSRYTAQFWYARALYLNNQFSEAEIIYEALRSSKVKYSQKNSIDGIITVNSEQIRFSGTIKKVETTYGFIERDDVTTNTDLYFQPEQNVNSFNLLVRNQKVSFKIGFTYRGPIAFDIAEF